MIYLNHSVIKKLYKNIPTIGRFQASKLILRHSRIYSIKTNTRNIKIWLIHLYINVPKIYSFIIIIFILENLIKLSKPFGLDDFIAIPTSDQSSQFPFAFFCLTNLNPIINRNNTL